MELFGIGIFEVILIVLIALIFLGPQDTIKAGRNLGRAVRRFFSSEEWRTLLQASRDIRTIPEKLLEETGLDKPEEILPSAAEIRQEAGLNDLEQNMAEWNADLSAMKTTGQAPSAPQTGQILPPQKGNRQTGGEAGLKELERDLSEWKADLSAWGNSPVIIPTPQTSTAPAAQTPASAEPAAPPQDQPPPEPPAQESTTQEPAASSEPSSSSSPEQGKS